MKYYVTMTRMIESTAMVEIEAASEDAAIDKAEAIFLKDLNGTEINWIENGIEGIHYDVDVLPPVSN